MMPDARRKVIHVTTVHPWWDNRIYEKMVSVLPRHGWDVTYVAMPPHGDAAIAEGVTFVPLRAGGGVAGRLRRNLDAFLTCLRLPKQIVHFHDPEFLPFAILLRLLGRRVIYDIHEDNFLGVLQKPHVPGWLRRPLACVVAALEQLAVRIVVPVIAEKAYLKRFPRGVAVLNYLKASEFGQVPEANSGKVKVPQVASGAKRMLYTGSVSVDRGALNHIDLLKMLPEYELYIVGRCDDQLRNEMIERAGVSVDRLHLVVDEAGVPYPEIEKYYRMGGWSWALAVFPHTPHYFEKELTKFFEYMYYRIPIVCSGFPVWVQLIEENCAGIYVDEKALDMAASAMRRTDERYAEYRSMRFGCSDRVCWESQLQRLIDLYYCEAKKVGD